MGAVIEIKREHLDRQPADPAPSMRMRPCRVLAASEGFAVNEGFAADGGFAVVETPFGARSCRLAASCLLRPEPGDLVLAALPEEENAQAFILAVLERAEAASPAMLDLPAGAVVSAVAGSVRIEAGQGISLSTPGELAASSGSMTFASDNVRWLTRTWSVIGKALEFVAERLTETAGERDTQAKTWTQRLGDCFRHVEELDETQAGMVRTLARDTALLHGRVTYVQAEEFVKVDGEEVHLG